MASELLQVQVVHHCDNFKPNWQSRPFEATRQPFTYGCRNVQSNVPKKSWMGQRQQQRPPFLRLDSTGESADSSPEPDESFGNCQKRKQTHWDTSKPQFRASNNGVQREVAAKARRITNSFHFQGNNFSHSKESLGPVDLEILASRFNSCSTNQESVTRTSEANCQGSMSHCVNSVYNQDSCPRPPAAPEGDHHFPLNMRPFPNSLPPSESQQSQTEGALSFIDMSVFRPNFIHQPMQRWHHQQGSFPNRPPIVPPRMAFTSSPFYPMPCGPPPPPNFNFFPHRAPFTPFRFHPQQIPIVPAKEQKHLYSANRRKNSNRERAHPRIITKILQRPSQKETSEKYCGVAHTTTRNDRQCGKSLGIDVVTGKGHQRNTRAGTDKKKQSEDCSSIVVENSNVDRESINAADSIDNDKCASKTGGDLPTDGAKQRHASIEFLLGSFKSGDRLSDSDFVDCDWDTLDTPDDHAWDEYFLGNDPYNPLTGWRCQKSGFQAEEVDSDDKTDKKQCTALATAWSHRSQDFDSGTESGSEGETNSESDEDLEEEGDFGFKVTSSSLAQREDGCSSSQVVEDADGCNSITKQTTQDEGTNIDETDSAKRQKCLHPSISYVLGGYSAASEDSDEESDDWDSFDDSDDDDDCTKPDQSSLFQFSNNRFPPLSYFLRNPLMPPKVKSSPSVPCGPIFKPKARTVLISQRIICQVSDHPVSMVVPLEQSGRMSQNSMPTIQVTGQASPKVTFPVSCLKSLCGSGEKKSKKVHFSNKATLVVCPEPSHLIEEIKNTRRGPWLDYARDRCRFQHRIQHLQRVIGPCLSPEHRKKVWERIQESSS